MTVLQEIWVCMCYCCYRYCICHDTRFMWRFMKTTKKIRRNLLWYVIHDNDRSKMSTFSMSRSPFYVVGSTSLCIVDCTWHTITIYDVYMSKLETPLDPLYDENLCFFVLSLNNWTVLGTTTIQHPDPKVRSSRLRSRWHGVTIHWYRTYYGWLMSLHWTR